MKRLVALTTVGSQRSGDKEIMNVFRETHILIKNPINSIDTKEQSN